MDAPTPGQGQPPTQPPQPPQPPVSWSAPPQPHPAGDGAFNVADFISFRYLITPAFVTVIYVLGVVVITLGALASLASAGGLIAGVLVFLFGNLYWRIILEFIMVLFRMNDSLQSIDRRGKGM
jgi:hypothetical protein